MGLIQQILGIGAQSVNWYQAALRAVIIYIATLGMVHIGEKRFLGKSTAFDVVVGVILGSMVSSAINNLNNIVPSIVAGFVLVGMHWLFAVITYRSNILDDVLKGTPNLIVENGEILWDVMRKTHVTRKDLIQQVRSNGHTEDLASIKKAYFERNGEISVIPKNSRTRVLEVNIEDGVKTVRIILESDGLEPSTEERGERSTTS